MMNRVTANMFQQEQVVELWFTIIEVRITIAMTTAGRMRKAWTIWWRKHFKATHDWHDSFTALRSLCQLKLSGSRVNKRRGNQEYISNEFFEKHFYDTKTSPKKQIILTNIPTSEKINKAHMISSVTLFNDINET